MQQFISTYNTLINVIGKQSALFFLDFLWSKNFYKLSEVFKYLNKVKKKSLMSAYSDKIYRHIVIIRSLFHVIILHVYLILKKSK